MSLWHLSCCWPCVLEASRCLLLLPPLFVIVTDSCHHDQPTDNRTGSIEPSPDPSWFNLLQKVVQDSFAQPHASPETQSGICQRVGSPGDGYGEEHHKAGQHCFSNFPIRSHCMMQDLSTFSIYFAYFDHYRSKRILNGGLLSMRLKSTANTEMR